MLDVALGGRAAPETGFGDTQAFPLHLDVFAGDTQSLIERSDLHVVGRDVGGERYQDVVIGGDRGQQRGVRRLDAAPEAAPNIDLPGGLQADLILPVLQQIGRGARLKRRARASAIIVDGAERLLRLGIELADSDAELGAGLQHPHAGGQE